MTQSRLTVWKPPFFLHDILLRCERDETINNSHTLSYTILYPVYHGARGNYLIIQYVNLINFKNFIESHKWITFQIE